MEDDFNPAGGDAAGSADREAPAAALEYADEYALNDIGIVLRLRALDAAG